MNKWHLHKLVVRKPSNEVVKELGWFADRRYATEAALGSGLKKEEFGIMNSDKAVSLGSITQDEVDELLLKKAEIGARRLATEMRKGHVTQEEVDKYLIVKGKNVTDSKASEANLNNLNNDAMFAWARFYESVADKLFEFKYRRRELVKGIHKIVEQVDNLSGYDDKFKDGTTGPLKDICPFTSIGLFTRFHSFDDRIIIASKLADFLGVKETAPKTFEGIPVLPMPFVAWFFVYEKDRGNDDIDILWEIFEKAIEFSRNKDARSAFINAYDKAARVKGIKWNLTIGLYWIRPWSFLSLDSSTRDYLEKEFDIKIQNKLPSAEEYLNILETLERIFQKNESPVHSFPELSLAAWESKHQENGNGNLGENAMNLILYGPPGTGKTYQLLELAEEYSSNNTLLSRKAWLLEELSEATWFEVILGTLYDLDGKAKVKEIFEHEYVQAKADATGHKRNIRATIRGYLQRHTHQDSNTVLFANRGNPPAVFDKETDKSWYLVDDWKEEYPELLELAESWKAGPKQDSMEKQKRFEFVTFHQAYSYEDFVEGIRPVPDEETGDVTYEVVPGIFKRICEKAKADPEYWYAIFIDEINRGNIASIFGELITLIETDKRADYDDDGDLKSGMTLTLPYSREQFGVPANLNIFGAMNTADRSIALLDTALRRRFEFEELMPDTSVIEGSQGDGTIKDGKDGAIDLRALLKAINRRILFLLNRDMTIGHSYFMKVRDFEDLKEVLLFRIIPLLQEYFYEDWHRIQLVFRDVGPNGEKLEPQIIRHEPLREEEIIGFDHDDFEDSFEYRVADEDQITPKAIRKVYEDGKKISKSDDEEN